MHVDPGYSFGATSAGPHGSMLSPPCSPTSTPTDAGWPSRRHTAASASCSVNSVAPVTALAQGSSAGRKASSSGAVGNLPGISTLISAAGIVDEPPTRLSYSPMASYGTEHRHPLYNVRHGDRSDGNSWPYAARHKHSQTPAPHGHDCYNTAMQGRPSMPLPPPLEPSFDDAARPFYHHHQSATLTLADSDTRRSSSGHVSPSTYSVSSSGSVANNIRSASSGYASSADSPPQTVQVLSTSNSESSLAAASRVPKKVVARRRTSPRHHMATAGKEYTVEQLDFIRYMKVDQKRTWREVAALHNERWPPIISSSSSSSPANVTSSAASAALRTEQGVNGVFYRKNARVPALDDATGLPILDEEGNIVYTAEKVRSQMALGRLRGLLNTWPERAVGYEWVDEKDRELAAATKKRWDEHVARQRFLINQANNYNHCPGRDTGRDTGRDLTCNRGRLDVLLHAVDFMLLGAAAH